VGFECRSGASRIGAVPFRNGVQARCLQMAHVNAPAGWEHYLRELAAAASDGGLTPALMVGIPSRHDLHLA
jgi:hypothetical protein